MTIIYCTYFDHIERCGYKPELIVENWNSCDKRVVFTSTNEEAELLRSMNLRDAMVVPTGISINVPSDIPKAQNVCLDMCYNTIGANNVVYIMGDQYLTGKGDQFIRNSIWGGFTGSIPSMGVSLYSKMWVHYFQLIISNYDNRITYNEKADGEETVEFCNVLTQDLDLALDIGYISTEAYYKHLRNHIHIWGKPDVHYDYKKRWLLTYEGWVHAYDNVVLDYVTRMACKAMVKAKQRSLEPIDVNIYSDLIDKMGLWLDYERVSKIVQEFA